MMQMLFLFFTMFFAFSGLYTYHGKISERMNSGGVKYITKKGDQFITETNCTHLSDFIS